jgi:hypothetical protein
MLVSVPDELDTIDAIDAKNVPDGGGGEFARKDTVDNELPDRRHTFEIEQIEPYVVGLDLFDQD